MTYTFKLARRLAVSRQLCMLPALLLIAACSGDSATAPEGPVESTSSTAWSKRDLIPVMVLVNPSSVTLETNQLIQFRALGRTDAGDSVGVAVKWSTSGGTILPDGRFSAAAIGTFSVIARGHNRSDVFEDTAVVSVVRRQTKLASILVRPSSVSLIPGVGQQFTAVGRLANGSSVPIGVNWSATGGAIDGGGTFVAGDTAGTYRVIASNTSGTVADTAVVTISAPPSLPPPTPAPPADTTSVPTPPSDTTPAPAPPSDPAPAPTPPPPVDTTPAPPPPPPILGSVILKPVSVTLVPGTSKQFAAFGRTTSGDSVAVGVVFTATGGTITRDGLYTAGSTAGSYHVVATAGSVADTSTISVTVPLASAPEAGVPYGSFNGFAKANTGAFTMSHDATTALNIIDHISAARRLGIRLSLALLGGGTDQYLTNGVWDKTKWTARLQTYNTPAIRQAVTEAVNDGTVIMGNVMDEPFNRKWGPEGTLTKAIVDGMCADVKAVFPTLPVGPTHDHDSFEPTKSYRVCDYILSQYRYSKGDVTQFRDAGLALARRDGHSIAFSINLLDGGYKIAGCPVPETGGPGTYGGNCRMTAAQVREYARVLGPAGCAMFMWRYESSFMANPDNIQAFRDVAAALATAQRKSCGRP